MSNLVLATRTALGLSQSRFGAWLAEQLGRESPIPAIRISEWERGTRRPRRNVRMVCAPVVSRALADHAVTAIARAMGADIGDRLPPDLAKIRDELAEKIMELIV